MLINMLTRVLPKSLVARVYSLYAGTLVLFVGMGLVIFYQSQFKQHIEEAQDVADAQALYAILEQQVVPTFYDRGPDGIPRRWLQVVRQSIRTVLPRFSARRMVKEYVTRMYAPAAAAGGRGQ